MHQNNTLRIFYLDLLRILATFAVIYLHVVSDEFHDFSFSWNWYCALTTDSLVRWCVPVFVMISGALFLDQRKSISYTDIITKYIYRLLFVYVFWSIVYFLLLDNKENFSLMQSLKRLLQSHFHLWFLPMLAGVYLLIPVMRKIVQDSKLLLYVLVIWAVYVHYSFYPFTAAYKLVGQFYSLFTMNMVIGFCGYFMLGYYLSHHRFKSRQKVWVYAIGVVAFLYTIGGSYYFSRRYGEGNERCFSYLSLHVAAAAVFVFVLVKELAPKCGTRMLKFTESVRKDLFGVYLIHAIWLPVINTYQIRHCCNVLITMPIISMLIFILSLITTKLIRQIPILRQVVE